MIDKIDVMIDSGSRPFLLKKTLPTIIENLKFVGNINWIFHEVFIDEKLSRENIEYIKSLNKFNTIIESKPLGQTFSIGNALKKCISDYFFHIEDDHILTRNIDLNEGIHIMDGSNVNQIAYNKRKTMKAVSGWVKKEYKINDHIMTTSPHWRFTPALWKLSYIKPKWKNFRGNNGHWDMNKLLKQSNGHRTPEWINNNTGTFYYGPIKEPGFCKHIGGGFSNRI